MIILNKGDVHVINLCCHLVFSLSEFGEVDLDKLKAAVKTFIHSCAGYSVATYVLV